MLMSINGLSRNKRCRAAKLLSTLSFIVKADTKVLDTDLSVDGSLHEK